jgi:hypothetical protein
MNQAVAPPILSAAHHRQLCVPPSSTATGRPADAAKSQVARRRRTPLPHECPSTQIMLICACKAISPSRRLRIQIGGSARGYQAIFVASATLGSPGYDGQPAVYFSLSHKPRPAYQRHKI